MGHGPGLAGAGDVAEGHNEFVELLRTTSARYRYSQPLNRLVMRNGNTAFGFTFLLSILATFPIT